MGVAEERFTDLTSYERLGQHQKLCVMSATIFAGLSSLKAGQVSAQGMHLGRVVSMS
jgi:hypothetical protein